MGLRERKKVRTRQVVQQVAMQLFDQHGYAATTVEQIAAAAEISTATFYRYYSDKEDVVLSLDASPFVDKVLTECPANASLDMIVQALFQHLATWFELERELVVARYRIIHGVAELQGRSPVRRQAMLKLLANLIAPRFDLLPGNYELRFAIAIGIAAQAEAVSHWAENGGRESLGSLLTDAFHKIKPALKIGVESKKVEDTKSYPKKPQTEEQPNKLGDGRSHQRNSIKARSASQGGTRKYK
jgi:AcrR family transcriptional regulator